MAETMTGSLAVSVVVPVYNSPALEMLTDGIDRVLSPLGDTYEIVFVDDGSPDSRTWEVLQRLSREREHVRAVQLTRNFGQQAATLCGLREARGDIVITMDDDLQHDPDHIPLLLAQANHDVVIAQFQQKEHHVLRRIASAGKAWFDRIIIGTPAGLRLSSFRLLRRTVVDGVLAMRTPHPFLPALVFHVTRDVVGVPVTHSIRAAGRSGYTLRKLLATFSNLVINNSSILLRVAAMTGIFFAGLSFALAAVVVYRKLFHGISVQGWASLFAATMLIGGLVLVSIGIIGEYLIRIVENVEQKPTYFVRRRSR
jgi:dolichol-phosphate mannosyltransferase/undecaprenyl-phosphate 4-deoxy-4-formamido-L-arabinose transferase